MPCRWNIFWMHKFEQYKRIFLMVYEQTTFKKLKNSLSSEVPRLQSIYNHMVGRAASFLSRVSTKWLNLLRKICAIFEQILFLRTFSLFLRMKRNEFCAIFCASFANRQYFLRKLRMKRNFSIAQLRKTASFTQNVTF